MDQIVVCIPAYNPTKALLLLLEELHKHPFKHIVIVNDGSDASCNLIFEQIAHFPNVTILQHSENQGKGCSIKTALQMIRSKYKSISGVLTSGADGQHTVRDIVRIANNSKVFGDGIIIGMRDFQTEHLSVIHKLHNQVFTKLFHLLFQKKLLDFQSGLRFYPQHQLSWIQSCDGERFEYDLNVIIEAIRREVPIYELPIGKVKVSKSSFLQYDEITHPKLVSKQLIRSFLKRDETFR